MSAGVGDVRWSVVTVHDRDERQVREGLARVRSQIAATPSTLTAVGCATGRCHPAREITDRIDEIRRELQSIFPPSAAALYEAIDREIDSATGNLGSRQALDTIRRVRLQADLAEVGYAAEAVEEVFRRMEDVLARVLRMNRLAVNLTVQSDPADADFVIQIKDNERSRRRVTTNAKLENVWRGEYTATVQKPGFKTAEEPVDIFNSSATKVSCTLRLQTDPNPSRCQVR